MGKQLRFYMLPEDELAFLQFICSDQAVVILATASPEPRPLIIDQCLTSLSHRSTLNTILLWNTLFSIEDSDVREGRLREYREEQGTYIETGERVYSIDRLNAPVIEFVPSFVRPDGQLVKGRIWAEMFRLVEGERVHKGLNFEAWYDRVARWIRRNFKRVGGIDGYLGTHALSWYREGGELSE